MMTCNEVSDCVNTKDQSDTHASLEDTQSCPISCLPTLSNQQRYNFDLQKLDKRRERILVARGAFKWLPVLCSNDLVHGSWWFVWGSIFGTIISIFPLLSDYIPFFRASTRTLPMLQDPSTWGLLISSGVFFTLGSLAFVRAFEDPPLQPLFKSFRHCATDELLGIYIIYYINILIFIKLYIIMFYKFHLNLYIYLCRK